jgi:nucleoside-diphosphate-sugar epimerase
MRCVVVTGASGNVGTALLDALQRCEQIDRVVGVARRRPSPTAQRSIEWVSADVGQDPLDGVMEGADALVHLAWRFQPTRNRRSTWHSNVGGTLRTLDAASRAGVGTIVYASSVGAYSPASEHDRDHRVDETWPTNAVPDAAYGTQKSYLERALDAFELAHPDVRVVRIRSAFVFQPAAAPEQRRIFAGPFLPGRLVAGGGLPVVPLPKGLRFQTVHAADLADAYVAALVSPVRGAFNIAADPVIRPAELADVLRTRVVEVPAGIVRTAFAAAFHLRLVPAEPGLLDLFLSLPLMDATRARRELGWRPRHTSVQALQAFLAGLRDPRGGPTPPLDPTAGGRGRLREFTAGVGQRDL